MSARIVWRVDVPKKIDKAGLEAQKALVNSVLREAEPYTPMDLGNLINSGTESSLPNEGLVIYSAPYAHRLYYGDKFNFDRTKNKDAGSRWVERMKREHMESIEREAKNNFRKAMK